MGLYALWKTSLIAKWWKITATVIVGLIVIGSASDEGNVDESQSIQKTADTKDKNDDKKDLTPEERDSIERVEKQEMIENRENNTITASALNKEYKSNEVKADQKFKGKKLFVVGIVDDISKTYGTIGVSLKVGDRYSINSVNCEVNDENEAANLNKGQKVTFYCECNGKTGTSKAGRIEMNNCDLVKNLETLKSEIKQGG